MSFLTKKMGPLPVWGWGAIAAGGTFMLLKGGGGGGGGGKPKGQGQGGGSGSGSGGSNTYTGTSNITADTNSSIDTSAVWGSGNLGFLLNPLPAFQNVFVHLHRDHERGGWWQGGRRYNGSAFEGHGWGSNGERRSDWNSGTGRFGGTRGFGGGSNGRSSRYRDNNASSPGNHSRNDTTPTVGNGRGSQR